MTDRKLFMRAVPIRGLNRSAGITVRVGTNPGSDPPKGPLHKNAARHHLALRALRSAGPARGPVRARAPLRHLPKYFFGLCRSSSRNTDSPGGSRTDWHLKAAELQAVGRWGPVPGAALARLFAEALATPGPQRDSPLVPFSRLRKHSAAKVFPPAEMGAVRV